MQTPYQILNIAADASDSEIKQAYLGKVKQCPPDHNQQQFQLIHDAYSSIKDHTSRVSYALFNLPIADFNEVIEQTLSTSQTLQIKPEHFIKILSASVDETTFLKAVPRSK